MTRDEWAARLAADAADAERVGAVAPLALTYRRILAELEAVDGWPTARPAPDVMLTLEEAAARLNVPKRWLVEHGRDLPFVKRYTSGGTVRVSAAGLARWLATR